MATEYQTGETGEEYEEVFAAEENAGQSDDSSFLDIESVGNDITLESILAEYKGSAYIDGDKKTPPSVLQEKTDKIVSEVIGIRPQAAKTTASPAAEQAVGLKERTLSSVNETQVKTKVSGNKSPEVGKRSGTDETPVVRNTASGSASPRERAESDVIAFDKLRYSAEGAAGNAEEEVNSAIRNQTQLEEDTKRSARSFFGTFSRKKAPRYEETWTDEPDEDDVPSDEDVFAVEEEIFEEPEYRQVVKTFAEGCNRYSMRSFISLVISVVMALLTLVFQSGPNLPFGIGNNQVLFTGILLILLFVVMMLSIDKLVQGLKNLFSKGPGLEFLNLMSCLATITAGAYSMITRDTSSGMPYCVVSAFSLTFTLWGEKIYYRALTETMKTVISVSKPCGVVAEISEDLNKTVIKKAANRTAGFYNNLVQADVGETAYRYASPILVVAAIVLGIYASVGHELTKTVFHNIAAVMAAAAPFSAMMTFAVPFNAVARRARKSGAAISGWGGADDIFHSDGASITDDDLFPPGTVTLGGIKIFEEVSPEKALRYTASLIIASNSGLSKIFSEQISRNGLNLIRVEDFTIYEGGIGGKIRGEHAIVGSAAFMNLMGIRIPASLNMKNAIFTAVNKRLIAVFAVNYVPVKAVQNALISILRYRVKLFFAMRDFNITPVMLEQKYKIPVDDVEYIPIRDSYDISDATKHEAKRVSAVLTRDGLGPYAEAITGGRRLRTTSLIATIFSLFSAVFGMLLMFVICWTGAYTSASASNLLLYMLSMLFVVLIIAGFAKFRQ